MSIKVALGWDTDRPDGTDEVVANDLRRHLEVSLLRRPSGLIFHHVFLAGCLDGPSVLVYGKPGSDVFWCKYSPITEWRSYSEAAP